MPHYSSRGLGFFQRPTSQPDKANLSPKPTFSYSATEASPCGFKERVSSCHQCRSDLLKSMNSQRILLTFQQAGVEWNSCLLEDGTSFFLTRRLPAAPTKVLFQVPPFLLWDSSEFPTHQSTLHSWVTWVLFIPTHLGVCILCLPFGFPESSFLEGDKGRFWSSGNPNSVFWATEY